MRNVIGKLGALGAGALAMYYLDPQLGAQRRTALVDLVRSGMRGQQLRGSMPTRAVRRAYHLPPRIDPQTDAELRDRIRDRLGRLVSHPRAIEVGVEHGVVRLSGHVLAKERDGLLLQVQDMPGVQKLVNAMTAHEHPQGITSLDTQEPAGALAAPGAVRTRRQTATMPATDPTSCPAPAPFFSWPPARCRPPWPPGTGRGA